MLHDWKMELYWRLPVRIQEIGLSFFARKIDKVYYTDEYEQWWQWLMGWRGWSRLYVKEWESAQIQKLVGLAANKVPYYRDKWKNIKWQDVISHEDLQLLPTIDKQEVRQNEKSFVVDGIDTKSLWVEKTSGTTGTSLKIYCPMSMMSKWWAFYEVMIRNVAGVSHAMPRAMMGGRPVIRGTTSNPPFWRYNRRWKQLYFSSYHVSRQNAPYYIGALRKYGSTWITGYGSAIAALAESSLSAGLEPYTFRNIIVSGDTLLQGMRSSIERYFQCKCFDSYGQCEGVNMAMECPRGNIHVIPMFGIMEILREDGTPCAPGEVGEIVGTSLLNDTMPLIRYRTGDYASWAGEQDCPCGNKSPIIKNLEGRVDDYLVTSDGRKIGRLSTAMKRSPSIHSSQIVQDRPGHAYLLVRPGEGYKLSHAVAVKDDILERIGKLDMDIIEVSEIPKMLTGKMVLVVRLKDRPYMREIYEKIFNKRS